MITPVEWAVAHITQAVVDAEIPSKNVTARVNERPPPKDDANWQFPFAPSRLRVTVVVPEDAPPTSDTLSCRYTFSTIPGNVVSRASSFICVTVIEPDSVAATAMAVWVKVAYELTDDAATMIDAPVACADVHLTNIDGVAVKPSPIVCVFVAA